MLSAIFRWNFSGRTVRGPTRNYLARRRGRRRRRRRPEIQLWTLVE
jgi:hypothetical protein